METVVPVSKWARMVKDIAGNRCAICGSSEKLEAHHIEPRSLRPDLVNDLNNGLCLCHTCHYWYHDGSYTNDNLQHVSYSYLRPEQKARYDMVKDFKETSIRIVVPTDERLSARIAQAAALRGISKAQYMSDALRAALDADGVTLDSLPDE